MGEIHHESKKAFFISKIVHMHARSRKMGFKNLLSSDEDHKRI